MAASTDKLPMKQRILETADRLFYRQGIRAVGVDTIAAEIGISKRTLYNHFPSKNDLVAAYLIGRSEQAPSSEMPPAEQILRNFDRLERAFVTPDFRGCPFVNAIGELGDNADAEIKRIAREFKEGRRAWFRDCLRELKVANAEELATQLAILVDGAIAAHVVRGDASAARAAKQTARLLLRDAGVKLEGARADKAPKRRKSLYAAVETTRLRPSRLAR